MPYLDFHCHTEFSFDSESSPDVLCQTAIARGIRHLAFTDHCDLDCILDGLYEEYDFSGSEKSVKEMREKYGDKLKVSRGIELGEPHVYPEEAKRTVEERHFDFVLGSLHNLRGVPDFSFIDFKKMPQALIDSLVKRNFCELCEIAELPFVNAIAHVTYPLRYIRRCGRNADVWLCEDTIRRLFTTVAESGKALEVNTSPLRRGGNFTMPDRELLKLYRECGGSLVTVGSDAHLTEDVGANIDDALAMLDSLGFETVSVFGESGREDIKIKSLL